MGWGFVWSSKDQGFEFLLIRELGPFIEGFEEFAAHGGRGHQIFVELERSEKIAELKGEASEFVDACDGHDAVDLSLGVFSVVAGHGYGLGKKQGQLSAIVSGRWISGSNL